MGGLKKGCHVLSILVSVVVFVEISMAAPIPSDVKNIVTFIFLEDDKGRRVPNGTGFFVGVKNEGNPHLWNVYLVTAKHVLQNKQGKFYPTVWLRLNKHQGNADFVRLDLKADGQKRVFSHPMDTTVDIAVIPGLPDQQLFDFKFLPDNLLTTKQSFQHLGISEGSDVFFTGLFTPHYGQHRNYPIVRFGRVALISDERVLWKTEAQKEEMLDLYLIETQSFGGNSGSPVFFYLGSDRQPGALMVGPPELKLAGVMQGTFMEGQPIRVIETGQVPVSISNLGIAAVVPSYLLHEILFSDELKKQRAKVP